MQLQERETDYLGISMLAGVAVKGCKETETGCIAGTRVQLKPPRFSGGGKPGKIHGQIRIQIAHVRGFGCSIPHSRKGREGKGREGEGRTYLVAGEAPDEEPARAAPLPCRR